MIKSDIQYFGINNMGKENNINKNLGNIIFECDDKFPSSIENVVNLFKVVQKCRKDGTRCNMENVVTTMKNNYDMDENETRRCIVSLYLDGAVNVFKDQDDIVFSSKFSGKRNYPSLLRERIRVSFLTNICKMYMKMNLQVAGIVSDFSTDELLDYLTKENIKIQRVQISKNLLIKLLEKLSRGGFINKQDEDRYAITNKTIKFGIRLEVFSKFSSDFNVEKVIRTKAPKVISNNKISKPSLLPKINCVAKSNFGAETLWSGNDGVLRDINTRPELFQQIITSNMASFNNVHIMPNLLNHTFQPQIFPVVMKSMPIFSQIIPHCRSCGQSSNENGLILQCAACNMNAHAVCEPFFNCSKATRWCKICRYSFQAFDDNTAEINLLCEECLNCRQNASDMCFLCQDSILKTDQAIVHLENMEVKESFDEILLKEDMSDIYSASTTFRNEEFLPQTLSFVEMLNAGEETASIETRRNPPVRFWSVNDVVNWLSDEGYGRLGVKFRSEEIDGNSLILLQEADLVLMKLDRNLVSELYSKIKKLE